MLDGLKQGCPLSPLLFILAIDPLLTHLEAVQGIEERCFADDLGVGFRDWSVLGMVAELIDYWSEAAGPLVSHRKTKIMTTDAARPELARVLPMSWRGVCYTNRYKYLGVMMSSDRGFEVAEVFQEAYRKFKDRCQGMMRMKKQFNIGTRVEMANTYLIPIFSYLMRFYIMDAGTMKNVNKMLGEWYRQVDGVCQAQGAHFGRGPCPAPQRCAVCQHSNHVEGSGRGGAVWGASNTHGSPQDMGCEAI